MLITFVSFLSSLINLLLTLSLNIKQKLFMHLHCECQKSPFMEAVSNRAINY